MLKQNLNQGEKLNFFSAFATRAAWVNIFTLQLYKNIFKLEAFPFQPFSILHIVHKEELGENVPLKKQNIGERLNGRPFLFSVLRICQRGPLLPYLEGGGGVIASSFCVSHHHQEL